MRWLFILLVLTADGFAAEPGEVESFAAAAKASQDKFYERAEKSWSEFLTKFPNSEKKAEAALALAQARHQLKDFTGALELLTTRMSQAGALSDQYRYWRGQTLLDMTNYAGAEETFAELLKSDTNSPLRLNAAVGQGVSRLKRDDLQGVIDLLGNTNGVFQQLAAASTNLSQTARGFLTLAEANFRKNDVNGVRTALIPLSGRTLPPELGWERSELLARAEFAGPNPAQALPALTNALAAARNLKRPDLVVQTLNLEAEAHKKLNRPEQAAAAYGGIVSAEGMPVEQKRAALLKQVELAASQNAYTNAAARISAFLAQNPNDPATDSLQIKAGELMLEAYRAQTNKIASPATNYLAEARAFLDKTIQTFTNSPLLGKALLNKGWTLWEEQEGTGNRQRLVESQATFQAAAEKLPIGEDHAMARLKAGDAQFKQELYLGAVTNYEAVLTSFSSAPNIRTNIAAKAAEQLVRSHMAQTNLAAAEEALKKTLALFSSSVQAQQSWLAMGQISAELGELARARSLLSEFAKRFPESELKAEAELAYARTFALEKKWPEAIDLYSKWTTNYPSSAALPQAEFDRAWFFWKAGQETNAFQALTNFVARFPTNPLSARAQYLIGDYYFNPPREQWPLAELSYQQVFQSTNWNVPELACQARMAAARTAFFRQSYDDAQAHLTNLINSACGPEIIAEAWFFLGDVLIEKRIPNSTNALENYQEALKAFQRIPLMGSTNRFEPLAWGKIGDCYFQMASDPRFPESYVSATNAYHKVLESKRTDVPVAARNQAEVGIALALERMADGRPPKEANALLQQALDHLLNVVYAASGVQPDEVWHRRAALGAGRLAERMKLPATQAIYTRFIKEIPSMKSTWEAKLQGLPTVQVQ